jgi:putative ABC transport system permease protein
MSGSKLIILYSLRLVRRQWRRFVLPFLSLGITAIVMILILLLSSSSTLFLDSQAKELLGGDVVLESTAPIVTDAFWKSAGVTPTAQSNQLSFSATLKARNTTAPFSIKVVDDAYPLYGSVTVTEGAFTGVGDDQLYLDAAGAERLQVGKGDTVSFGTKEFIVAGIISSEPTSLLSGFRFLPQVIMSQAGFESAGVDPALLRLEYQYAAKFDRLDAQNIEALGVLEDQSIGLIDVDIAGENQTGLQRGVQIVTDFLIVAVLITAVLAAVNVYASTLYLVTVERKSLAILLALGLTKNRLVALLGTAFGYVVISASIVGSFLGISLFRILTSYIEANYSIILPSPHFYLYALLCVGLILTIAIASFVPAIRRTLSLNPKQILIGGEDNTKKAFSLGSLMLITVSTLTPLMILSAFLLGDIVDGFLIIGSITLAYVVVAGLFSVLLRVVYKNRGRFSFFLRSIVSQKKADGLLGIVSFASLFVALAALSTLALLQISLERYLQEDLSRTVPTTYILDVQPSQKDALAEQFSDIVLFSNVGARIVAIDEVRVQDELSKPDGSVDRELGREFNLTSRDTLLSSEQITDGMWSGGAQGEISVDEDFAKRANIRLGSTLVFSIQGFEVSGRVTSLRATDSRSGLPFFYFVLSPRDLEKFPAVYFGYSYYDDAKQGALGRYLATQAPNVSVLETEAIGPLIVQIVSTLMILVLVVTLPPLLIATLLIATLVVSSYGARRKEGGRLRAIGATKSFVFKQYIAETISLTLVASVLAYVVSVITSFLISQYFFKLGSVTLFDLELITGLGLIVLLVGAIGLYLFKTDTMPLRELLSYGENS